MPLRATFMCTSYLCDTDSNTTATQHDNSTNNVHNNVAMSYQPATKDVRRHNVCNNGTTSPHRNNAAYIHHHNAT